MGTKRTTTPTTPSTTTTTTSTTSTTTTPTMTTDAECSVFTDTQTCAITEYTVEGFKHVDTPELCQELCRELEACLFFTWYEGGCYLLNSCDDLAACDCCVSGPQYPDVISCDVGCARL